MFWTSFPLYRGCLEQKRQTMQQYLKFNSMKALYILILQSLLRQFDSGISVQIGDNYFLNHCRGISSQPISVSNIEISWIMLVPLGQF